MRLRTRWLRWALVVLTVAVALSSRAFATQQSNYAGQGSGCSPDNCLIDSCSGETCWCCANFGAGSPDTACSFTVFAGAASVTLALSQFGFTIPTDATINGIQVDLRSFGDNVSNSVTVQLLSGNSNDGNTKTANVPLGSVCASATTTSVGSSSDLWGGTWAPSDINNIGVHLTTAADVFVNSVQVIVDFTTPTPTPTSTPTPTDTPTSTPTPTPTRVALGQACASGTQCLSTFCVSGICCDAACTEPNQSCNLSGQLGLCRTQSSAPVASPLGMVTLCALLGVVGLAGLGYRLRHRRR